MIAKLYEETHITTQWPHMWNKCEVFSEVGRESGQNNLILEGENIQSHLT